MLRRLAILFGLCLLLPACAGRLSAENYARISLGMSHAEVLDILGTPDNCWAAIGFSSCSWTEGSSSVSVRFVADRVVLYHGDGLR